MSTAESCEWLMFHRFKTWIGLIRDYGFYSFIDIVSGLLSGKPEFAVRFWQLPHPVRIRWRSSDRLVLEQILLRNESILDELRPQLIVDLGANIGLTTIGYAARFQDAKIIAVEPERENAKLLRANTQSYPGVTVVEKCIWSSNGNLKLIDSNAESWAFQFSQTDDGDSEISTPSITINELIAEEAGRVDLLKMDIEGGEEEVFRNGDLSWVQRTDWIIIEPHDHIRPGCTEIIRQALASTHEEQQMSGEYLVFLHRSVANDEP